MKAFIFLYTKEETLGKKQTQTSNKSTRRAHSASALTYQGRHRRDKREATEEMHQETLPRTDPLKGCSPHQSREDPKGGEAHGGPTSGHRISSLCPPIPMELRLWQFIIAGKQTVWAAEWSLVHALMSHTTCHLTKGIGIDHEMCIGRTRINENRNGKRMVYDRRWVWKRGRKCITSLSD